MSLPALLVACSTLFPAPQEVDEGAGIETIYVVEFCHADVGFNAPPSVMQQRNHDRTVAALDLMESWSDFHWTIETGYQLEGFLDRAAPADIARLRARLSEGRLDFGANYTNLHSGNCGEEQFHRLLYPSARFAHELGAMPRCVFLNDVPGFSVAMPRVLAASGVGYAVLGPNGTFGGRPEIPLQDRPFWWQARDGSRVLSWITMGSYAEGFVEWGMLNLATMNAKIPARLAEFAAAGYPYDAVLVTRAFDDTFPNWGMTSLAAQWNNAHTSPKIKLATAAEFFDHLMSKYGDVFPTHAGDASGLWEDVTTVTPTTTAWVRRSRAVLPDLEGLRTVLRMERLLDYPHDAFDEAWRRSMVFDEHSGGGVGWPGLLSRSEVEQENREFVAVARGCQRIVEEELAAGLAIAGPALVPVGEAGLVLFNPLGAEFHGVVEVDAGAPQPIDLRLSDPDGGPDAVFRWLDPARASFALETSIPARGWRRWKVEGGGSAPAPPAWSLGDRIQAGHYELLVDTADGTALQLVETATGFDWLGAPHPHPLGSVQSGKQLEVFFGITATRNPVPVTVWIEDPAPLFRRLHVLDPHGRVLREYRLHESGPRVDLRVWLRRSALPFVPFADHSVHYGVDFAANLVTPVRFFLDGADGEIEPGAGSLPGSQLASFGAGRAARLEGAQGRWLAVSSIDTPIVDLGEMDGMANTTLEDDERSLAWKLIRHHDEGKVAGGAIVSFDTEPGTPDATPFHFVARFGDGSTPAPSREQTRRDLSPPFFAWVDQGAAAVIPPASQVMLRLQGSGELVCWKRSERRDGMILRLRAESAGGVATLFLPYPTSGVWLSDLVERKLSPISVVNGAVDVPLAADGVVTLLVLDP